MISETGPDGSKELVSPPPHRNAFLPRELGFRHRDSRGTDFLFSRVAYERGAASRTLDLVFCRDLVFFGDFEFDSDFEI